MHRSKFLPLLFSALAISLVLTGCGLVSPALRLLSNSGHRGVGVRGGGVGRRYARTPDSGRETRRSTDPVSVGSDSNCPGRQHPETEIYTAVYRKAAPAVV